MATPNPRSPSLAVRSACPDDVDAILALLGERGDDFLLDQNCEYSREDFDLYARDDRTALLIAEDGQEAVGFLLGFDMLTWHMIDVLIVKGSRRRSGVGRALVEHLVSSLPGRVKMLEVCTGEKIPRAFMDGCGFAESYRTTQWWSRRVSGRGSGT